MREANPSVGCLSPHAIQKTLVDQTIEFIWECLIPWRDDPEREVREGEEELNAQFHDFLESEGAKRFPMVFFQHEQRQEGQRRVDLSAKPRERVVIEGITYTKYNPILVIEGKRLPAPAKSREKEYVTGGEKSSGGIQRFKLGLHGRTHKRVILLGYIQDGDSQTWLSRVNEWIVDFASEDSENWKEDEILAEFTTSKNVEKSRTISKHPRHKNCVSTEVEIQHFWVSMARVE